MLNNDVFISPESIFYDYHKKMEKQLCQVCRNLAVGFHYGAYVCEACKKFFKRYLFTHSAESVGCKEECDLERTGRRKCADCRYKKCLRVGMRVSMSLTTKADFDISKIPCRICGSKSSGFHFGSLTCEGCKGFFRRADMMKERLVCTSNGDCFINFSNRAMCKYCRYQQCVKVGMSKSSSRIGRQPNAVKHHCVLEITNNQGITVTTSEKAYTTSESSFTDSTGEEVSKGPTNSICLPIISSIIHGTQEPQLNILNKRIMEAMDILQMPFKEAMTLLQVNKNHLHDDLSLVEVWNTMMQHFDVHSHMLIQFAKRIPVFNELSLVDKRQLVQDSMYSIILLNLTRSYGGCDKGFNYFDFTEQEYRIILTHFPSMNTIMTHVMNISRVVSNLKLSHKQIGLFCVLELFKNFRQLESSSSVSLLYQQTVRLCWFSIIDQFMEGDGEEQETVTERDVRSYLKDLHCPTDLIDSLAPKIARSNSDVCLQKLRVVFVYFTQWLQKYNVEHQAIIDRLKIQHPELPYSQLYTEMFQLSLGSPLLAM